jgi:phosphoserine phosphatase RsbU/P
MGVLRGRMWGRALAPAVPLVLFSVLDALGGKGFVLLDLVVISPLLAASLVGPRLTAGYGVVALLAAGLDGISDDVYGDTRDLAIQATRLAGIAFGGLLAVAASVDRLRRQARLAQVSRVAAVAQRAVLPPMPRRVGNLHLVAAYDSAAAEATIGGDLYEAVATSWGARLIIADVRGKGLAAVRLANRVLGAFRVLAEEHPDLGDLMSHLDREVRRAAATEDFVTAVIVECGGDGRLTVHNAGHPDPLLLRRGVATFLAVPDRTPPLGLGGSTTGLVATLSAGERLLLYTDGLTEARHPRTDTFFPLGELAPRTLGTGSLDHGMLTLRRALTDWTGGTLDDDVALLAAEPVGPREQFAGGLSHPFD